MRFVYTAPEQFVWLVLSDC